MQSIEIRGAGRTPKAALLKLAIRYFIRELIPEDTNLKIKLSLVPMDPDTFALCVRRTDIPSNFHLKLRHDASIGMMLRSVAHEMIHVKQYITGQMVDEEHSVIWDGVHYPVIDQEKAKYEEQKDLPWEIEAYGRERSLYNKFLIEEQIKLRDYEW